MRAPVHAWRNATRLSPLVTALIVLLVFALADSAVAEESTSTTSSTAAQTVTTLPTASTGGTAAPTDTTSSTATSVPGADAGLILPPEGFVPLNPGWRTDQMDVQVWPEYDEKAVLVFLNFTLPPDVQLPATLKFPLPKGAVITGIGERDPSGAFKYNYADSYPPVEPGAAWDIATIQVQDFRSLQIDYYYNPGLPDGAGQRSFPVLLQLPIDVGTLLLHIQQPARSTGFTVQPTPQGQGTAEDGYTYAVTAFSEAKAGSTLGQVVSYNKTDGGLSIESGGSGSTKISTNTVLLAAILVVVVCVGALVVYRLFWSSGNAKRSKGRPGSRPGPAQRTPTKTAKKPVRDTRDSAVDKPAADANELLCAECGEALGSRDRFCPSCGASREDD